MEMTLASTYREIMDIASTPRIGKEFSWECVLHTPNGDYIVDEPKALVEEKEYTLRYSSRVKIMANIPLGDYIQDIYPYREFLELTIKFIPLIHNTETPDDNKKVVRFKYRAILANQDSMAMQSSSQLTADKDVGNRSKRQPIEFQLVEPIIDRLQNVTISGIFRGSPTNLLKALLKCDMELAPRTDIAHLHTIRKGTVDVLAGVDVVTPDNDGERKQWVFKAGTHLTDLARDVQNRYGLYNHHVGSFVERGVWYIWPLYNTRRFDSSDATLTVAITDKQKMPTSDSSFTVKDRHVRAIVIGDGSHIDVSDRVMQNEGNGVRYLDTSRLIDGYAATKDGITSIDRTQNVREYMVEERKDNLNYIAPAKPTANHYNELSKLNARRGSLLHVEWHNSDPDVLYPGMPVKVLYTDKKDVKQVFGTLVAARHGYAPETDAYTDKRVRVNSVLSFWCDRDQ